MARRAPWKAATYYDVSNLAAELLWRVDPDRYRLVRYEDLVRDPAAVTESIARFAGEPVAATSVLTERTFEPADEHLAWGNPNRFGGGPVTVSDDAAWVTGLSRLDESSLTALCGPLSWRYGYPFRRSGELKPLPRSARLADATLGERS